MRLKCGSLETEEDETQNEHFQNWSTHSAEIARLFGIFFLVFYVNALGTVCMHIYES